MLKKLTKKQVHSLLDFLDTLSSLDLTPGYSVIWILRSRTKLDMHWNLTRDDPRSKFGVSMRLHPGTRGEFVLDISEDDL
jgi:hypothetical protein